MTNSARLSGRPSSSAAYNVGDVVDTPDSAIKSWRYLGAGEWEPNDAVRYTTGPGGGVGIPALRTATRDRLADVLEWCRPVHRPILDPLRFVGMSPIVASSGNMTLSHNPSAGEFPGMSFGLDITAAGTHACYLQFPTTGSAAGVSAPIRVGPRIHARLKCSDWSKVTGIWIEFLTDGTTTKKYRWEFVTSGVRSLYGVKHAAYADAWNGKLRTFVHDSANMTASGTPAYAWGTQEKYLPCTGVGFVVVATAAVTFEVTRIYCPEWPIGAFAPIFDGWYTTAREWALRELAPRGWGAGGSIVRTDGLDGDHPTAADIAPLVSAGFDVFLHGHALAADGQPTPMESGVTRAAALRNFAEIRGAIADQSPYAARGLQWHQWLQNNGSYAGTDMAGELRSLGINAGRGHCSDAEWGIDPNNTTNTQSDERRYQSWANLRGRFNRRPMPMYAGIAPRAGYDDPTNMGDTTYPTLKQRVQWAADNAEPVIGYTHRVQSTPTTLDNTPEFMAGLVADLEAKERAGRLLILSPTDLERLTYWRNDREGLFMRWDNEWAHRSDPSKIAF